MAPRKGSPCPECGKVGCMSLDTFACWVRCCKRVLTEHDYIRCGRHTVMLRIAGVQLLLAPQPKGNEVFYCPGWAVRKLVLLREQATAAERRLYGSYVEQALRSDVSYGPPSADLLARLDGLRAYAILRGWRLTSGMWHK